MIVPRDQCHGSYDRAISRYSIIKTILPSGTWRSALLCDTLFIVYFTHHNTILYPLRKLMVVPKGPVPRGLRPRRLTHSTIDAILPSGTCWSTLIRDPLFIINFTHHSTILRSLHKLMIMPRGPVSRSLRLRRLALLYHRSNLTKRYVLVCPPSWSGTCSFTCFFICIINWKRAIYFSLLQTLTSLLQITT